MELSILVARIIAVIYISSGIGVLIGQINFSQIANDLNKSTALTFVTGSFGLMIGMVLVTYHNHWVNNWTVLITIIGWILFIGGLIVVIFPKILLYLGKRYKSSPVWGALMICFGLLFGYFGFLK
jgi:membrane protein YdbS with pleckstrin-like domain